MARITYNQNNFTAGELSPRLYGRTDIDRYRNGAKTIKNAVPLVHGGVLKRPGTRFVAQTKYNDARTVRLIPYIFNKNQSYILEFGDQYMRVYKDGAPVMSGMTPYEIATPFSYLWLRDIRFVQGADSMFLVHENARPRRLQRFDHDKWVMDIAPFVTEPFDEIGMRPSVSLTLSASTVGAGRTLTAAAATFYPSDVGREIISNGGIAIITAYTSTTVVTADITVDFPSTSIAGNQWVITGSPQSTLFSSEKGPVGAIVKLDSGKSETNATAKTIEDANWSGGNVTVKITAHGYANGDNILISACEPAEYYNGTWKIKNVTADTFQYQTGGINIPDARQFGYASKVTQNAAINTFRSDDVGKYVRINRGLVKITQYVSPTLVNGEVRQELDAKIPAQPGAWSLESSVWNTYNGYPRAVSLFEQRLVIGGAPAYPQQFWMSKSAEYLDFEDGVNDTDALSFVISSDQINPISHISQVRVLAALTDGGEFTVRGGIEKPITPTNVQIKNQSAYGCNSVKPVRISNELLFVQRGGAKILAFAYKSGGLEGDDYDANDLTILAEHITESGIVDMAYQQEPDSILWCVRNDGVLVSLTINRAQDVIAWAQHESLGSFESVASIPSASGDDVYVVVSRTVGGSPVKYVERLDPAMYVDSGVTGTSVGGASVWSGLSHLNGLEVDILADGMVMPRQTVSAGQITLSRNAFNVQIGLPFSVEVDLLTPEIQTAMGSAQGNNMRTSEITIRFMDTIGCYVNGSFVAFRNFGPGLLDAPAESFSGLKRLEVSGWDKGSSDILITQDKPLPFHILSVIRKLTVND